MGHGYVNGGMGIKKERNIKMRIKSKIDAWVSFIFFGTVVILLAVFFSVSVDERLIVGISGLPVVLLLFWLYFDTWYEFRDDYLYSKSGPFFERIRYENIRSVKLSKNLLTSMALSVYRIEIRQHKKGFILGTTYISPLDREKFMEKLIQRCENLDRTDGGS